MTTVASSKQGVARLMLIVLCFVFDLSVEAAFVPWTASYDTLQTPTAGNVGCSKHNYLITGLKRAGITNNVGDIIQAKCGVYKTLYDNEPFQCKFSFWKRAMAQNNGWGYCSAGTFLHGIYRWRDQGLSGMHMGRCCKPSRASYRYEGCKRVDVSGQFASASAEISCGDGFFITGIQKGTCNGINCIKTIECCSIRPKPEEIREMDQVKTRVMDSTLRDLSLLANYLGFVNTASCSSEFVGNDFSRQGDSWIAPAVYECRGSTSSNRLKIHYKNFKLGYKRIEFGTPEILSLTPTSLDMGLLKNRNSSGASYSRSHTVTHSEETASSMSFGGSMSISVQTSTYSNLFGFIFESDISFRLGASVGFQKDTSHEKTRSLVTSTTKNVGQQSAVEFTYMMFSSLSTVPYTATLLVSFDVEFEGYLGSTNYYTNTYNANTAVKYTIGDSTFTFYDFLQKASNRDMRPWRWTDAMGMNPKMQGIIDNLTNKRQYEFTMSGILQNRFSYDVSATYKGVSLSTPQKPKPSSTTPQVPTNVTKAYPPVIIPQPSYYFNEELIKNPSSVMYYYTKP